MKGDEHPEYDPKPIDTAAIRLPPDVERLVPVLAENAHDVWAVARTRDGWRFGPERDDSGKRHPSLVPYAALSESEREYDRLLVREVLKAVISLGYRLEKP